MGKSKEEVNSTQKSIFYYPRHYRDIDPELDSHPNYYDGIYTGRLIKDVSLGIMPIGGRTKNEEFKVIITPNDKKVRDTIIDGINQDEYRQDLENEVCQFFQECAHFIMSYGEADYEIAYFSRPSDGTVIGFKLVLIPPTSLVQENGKFYEYLPKQLADLKDLSQNIQLSEQSVLRFRAPDHLRDDIIYLLKLLSSLGNRSTLPDFVMDNIGGISKPIPFDLAAFNYSHNLAMANAGKLIGWNSFLSIGNGILEYYWFHRFLLFEQFKINLRNAILSIFNEGLKIIGQNLGFSAKLEIKGLPSIEDVKSAQLRLADGSISFNELLDTFSLL